MVKLPRGLFLWLLTIAGVFLAGCWTRAIIVETMDLYQTFPIIKGFFSIIYVRNPGAAFGILANLDPSYRTPFLLGVSSLAILVILYLLIRERKHFWAMSLGLSLLAGGAIANFYERLMFGEVVDYLDFYLGNYHWPAFNLADVAISTGIGFVLLFICFKAEK